MKNGLKITLALSLACLACASHSPPTDLMSKAELSVKEAEAVGPMQAAPMEVTAAREKLDQAKKEMEKRNYDVARMLAEDAMVNAELATTKAQASNVNKTYEEMKESMNVLRREVGPNSQNPQTQPKK